MNRNDFLDFFSLPRDGFFDPIILEDEFVGFSVKKRKKNDEKNFISVLYVWLDLSREKKEKDLQSLEIEIMYGKFSEDTKRLTLADTWDDVNGPINITIKDEFFYDPKRKIFLTVGGKEIAPIDILKKSYGKHVKPTRRFAGAWIRLKLFFWRKILSIIAKVISELLLVLLKLISGKKLTSDIWSRALFPEKLDEEYYKQPEYKEPEKISLFGYKADPWPILFFAITNLIVYFFLFSIDFKPKILTMLVKNNFLSILYVISMLAILEKLAPKYLMMMIKKTSLWYRKFAYKSIVV